VSYEQWAGRPFQEKVAEKLASIFNSQL